MNKNGVGNPNWTKGQSGNLNGRPEDKLGKLIREKKGLPNQLVNGVLKIFRSKKETATTKIKAAEYLSERGWGKPFQVQDTNINLGNYKEILDYAVKVRESINGTGKKY